MKSNGIDRSFLTEDGTYDEEKFYCHSTDGRGHSETIRVPIPPTLLAEMGKIVQSKQFPDYNSNQDIARDALIHRLHFISTYKGNLQLKRIVLFEARIAERARQLHIIERMEFALEETKKLFQKAQDMRDNMALIDALAEARKELDDGSFVVEPWKTKMQELIKQYETTLKNQAGK